MFNKVLVANRGEIAVRVIRTLREMGIGSVAVFSEADRAALFVQLADEAYLLGPAAPARSYLNGTAIIEIARQAGADAVHPGYGFLAENAGFAGDVAQAGLVFIGPTVEAMRVMGDKVEARRAVVALGVPLVPGTPGPVKSLAEAEAFVDEHGLPVMVKAAGGGGGRGIRIVTDRADLAPALEAARREAENYFKNPEVYLERYFEDPRHVEIQVLGDAHGTLVHLGERDCSTQRRHQKLIEESPSPAVDRSLRVHLGRAALRAAASAGYTSAGTVEFLLTRDGAFYFLEMNTRIQVEHPVTEMVTGVDLIREMILIAAGEPMTVRESFADLHGHAIEARINAEDPSSGFRPTPEHISGYRIPGGPGIRVDSGVYQGFQVPPDYDSMLAKLIAWAPDRDQARLRLLRGLAEFEVAGPATTIPFSMAVLKHLLFVQGQVGTTFVERHLADLLPMDSIAAAAVDDTASIPQRGAERHFQVEVNRKLFSVRVAEVRTDATPQRNRKRAGSGPARPTNNAIVSPMHGTVIEVRRAVGELVGEGDVLFVIEAMKMENEVRAHRAGSLSSLSAEVGDTVENGQTLATID